MPETPNTRYLSVDEIRHFSNPPVGTIVHWYPQADNQSPKIVKSAAMITSHEGPGVVSLTVFPKAANPRYLFGVRYIRDPFHAKKSEATMKNGGWQFVRDTFCPPVRYCPPVYQGTIAEPTPEPTPEPTLEPSPSIAAQEPVTTNYELPKPRRGRPPKIKTAESDI